MGRTNGCWRSRPLHCALVAVPLAAQSFSDGFTFLKAVRERDGATVERILSNPSSTAVNIRDPGTGEGALHILARGRDLTWLAFMLGRGARPDIQSNDGTTPLILAAQIGWRDGRRAAARPPRQPQSRQPPRRNAADLRGPAPRPADGPAADRRARRSEPDRPCQRQFGDRLCAAGHARRGDPARARAGGARRARQPAVAGPSPR